MAKTNQPHGPYHVMADALALVGSFAQLGTTLLSHKIQSTAGSANAYLHKKINVDDIEGKLSEAAAGLGQAGDYALHTDVKQMLDDAAVFARKHPVASLAAGIVLGTLVARLMQPSPAGVDGAKPTGKRKTARATAKKGTKARKTRAVANGAIAGHGKDARS